MQTDITQTVQVYGTFGPSCKSREVLEAMIDAGMTGMRLNLSHSTLEEAAPYIDAYRHAARNKHAEPQILIDVQGPELRVGELSVPIVLAEGQIVCLCDSGMYYAKEQTEEGEIPVPSQVIWAVRAGDELLLDDGKIHLVVAEAVANRGYIRTRVARGGRLQSHKSIKVINLDVPMPALTEHDIANIKVAKDYGVTAVMQPFVRAPEDLQYLRKTLDENGLEEVSVFAKIENRQGVANLELLLPYADVIVIARGDLGNDMPLWELPTAQKRIERMCHKYQKNYIVVTQMLASMEHSPIPTRAEVSDIYHAVFHGAWGVMVTGETAVGKYPIETIRYLTNTAHEAVK